MAGEIPAKSPHLAVIRLGKDEIPTPPSTLKILCNQLQHSQKNLALLEAEINRLLVGDCGATRLGSVPEFGPKTVVVLRAELGDVSRFQRLDQVVAYAGLDIQVKVLSDN